MKQRVKALVEQKELQSVSRKIQEQKIKMPLGLEKEDHNMDPTIILAFLITYKVEIASTILLSFQGWLGKTDKVAAANYFDLVVQLCTVVSTFFKKKEESVTPVK